MRFQDYIIILLILIISIFHVNDSYNLMSLGISCITLYNFKKKQLQLSYLDIILFSILLYTVLSTFTAINYNRSFYHLSSLFRAFVFFFYLRSIRFNILKSNNLILLCNILFLIISFLTIIAFIYFYKNIKELGFEELYEFRFKFRPLGNLNNLWSSIILTCSSFIVLSLYYFNGSKISKIILYSIWLFLIFCVLISFSRGIYIALSFQLLGLAILKSLHRTTITNKILTIIPVVLLLLIFYYSFPREVEKIIHFNETFSQQRSINERIENIHSAFHILKENPILGIGLGNYSLGNNRQRFDDDNNSYTSFSPNGFIQLIIEQGFIGLLLWVIFFFILFQKICQLNRTNGYIILIIIVSLLIREVSFPSILNESIICIIIFIIISCILPLFPSSQNCHYIIYIIPIISIYISTQQFIIVHNNKINKQLCYALSKKDYELASEISTKWLGPNNIPFILNQSIIFENKFITTKDSIYLHASHNYIKKAIKKNPYDTFLKYYLFQFLEKYKPNIAISLIDSLTQIAPNNSLYLTSQFKILNNIGEHNRSVELLTKAILLSPSILESPIWENLHRTEPIIYNRIVDSLLIKTIIPDVKICSPIILAKYGKILYKLDKTDKAYVYLSYAIHKLPNLKMPWYYIGLIKDKKGKPKEAMNYYIKAAGLSAHNHVSIETIIENINNHNIHEISFNPDFLYDNYKLKFQDWYGSSFPTYLSQ